VIGGKVIGAGPLAQILFPNDSRLSGTAGRRPSSDELMFIENGDRPS
jgi:hypothetical protein